ncbi:hypothetical protein FF1_003761 [Malus domestica]
MKKVHIAQCIPSEYREWRWLLSPLRREKGRLPPREEVRRIKAEVLARLITVVELAANEYGKMRSSPPAQEMPAEKKPRRFSSTCKGSPAVPKLMIDLTSSKGEKDK